MPLPPAAVHASSSWSTGLATSDAQEPPRSPDQAWLRTSRSAPQLLPDDQPCDAAPTAPPPATGDLMSPTAAAADAAPHRPRRSIRASLRHAPAKPPPLAAADATAACWRSFSDRLPLPTAHDDFWSGGLSGPANRGGITQDDGDLPPTLPLGFCDWPWGGGSGESVGSHFGGPGGPAAGNAGFGSLLIPDNCTTKDNEARYLLLASVLCAAVLTVSNR